jgi:two-component system LytT family response regulator
MSPEQVRGARIDPRSDVFSFGALLYELVAGQPAFRRESGVETMHAVLKDPAPRLAVPGLGAGEGEFQRIVQKCLEKDAADRYQGMRDLVVDLRAVRRALGEPSPSGAPATPAPVTAPPPRTTLRVAIVDDEDLARTVLREYLSREPDCEVVAECRNGFEAVKAVSELKPDLLFLDVQMPKLTGLEVLELIGRDVLVIFVTAFDEHAVRAFEVNAVDYLLKPVGPERFAAALARARERVVRREPQPVKELLSAVRPANAPAERILVRQGNKVQVVLVADLDWAEAQDDYVGLHSKGHEYLKQQTLAELEASLDPARFVRIHRSYLVNLDRLSRIESDGADGRTAVLSDGTRLPVSRSGYAKLKSFL